VKLDFGRFEKKLDELYKIAEERPEGVEEFLRGMEDVHYTGGRTKEGIQ